MALVSLAQPREDEAAEMAENPYGYGTRVCLTSEQCAALGITTPPKAGSQMMVIAKAMISRSIEEADVGEEETEVYLELQLTDMELRPAESVLSAATVLYGE